jgi:hypothetical protein
MNEELLNRTLYIMKEVEKLSKKKFMSKFNLGCCKNVGKVDKKTLVLGSLMLFVESLEVDDDRKQSMKEYIKNEIPIIIDNIINFYNTVKH